MTFLPFWSQIRTTSLQEGTNGLKMLRSKNSQLLIMHAYGFVNNDPVNSANNDKKTEFM
jgi:hypothetical protein